MVTFDKKKQWIFLSILILIIVAVFIYSYILNPQSSFRKPLGDNQEVDLSYYTVTDEKGNIILETGLPIYVNDEYYDENDTHYVITAVKGNKATAVLKENTEAGGGAVIKSMVPEPNKMLDKAVPTQVSVSDLKVGIYHTHTDECYFPTSKKLYRPGDGDVYEVGDALTDALKKHGINVTHNLNTHDPHDINAYHRSRRTAAQLLKENPDMLIDVHRDAAPAYAYQTTINGIPTTKVMIVIGRSNPNMAANLEFAKKIKAKVDELHPGLMRGIFMGKGNYNQDLHPRAILFEVGTVGNYQLSAERGVRGLSDAIVQVLSEE